MRPLSPAEVLSVWERSQGRPPLWQALEMLACAAPERPAEEWSNVPFGQVCRMLFQLRALMFGREMPGVVSCPQCGQRLEFSFECQSVEAAAAALPAAGPLRIQKGDQSVEMRLPTPSDLLQSRSAEELFQRCTGDGAVEPDADWIQAASATVAKADPLSETVIDLVCAACGHAWETFLDIASYLASEVSHEATRLLAEVHTLAAVYGWPETNILALSPVRRRAYLELAGA